MAKLYNLARMTTATVGTGTITLGSAVSGFLSFAGAGVSDGDTITYAIKDGSNSELGRGVYTSSGTTLTRNVIKSTNSNTAISLSGTAQVAISPAAEDFPGVGTSTPFLSHASPVQIGLSASVASNLLTVALKGNDGSDATSSRPIMIPFRDSTIANGGVTWVNVTSSLSISTNATGATLGTSNSVPFRLWVVAFNNSGTVVLALWQAVTGGASPTAIASLNPFGVASSTAISGSATAAATFYTPNGTTVTSKSYCVLGYVEYGSGLATAGTYASAPTKIQLLTDGVAMPSQVVQTRFSASNSVTTTTSSSFVATNSTTSITPTSAANVVFVQFSGSLSTANAGNLGQAQIHRGGTAIGPLATVYSASSTLEAVTMASGCTIDAPQSTSSTTYDVRIRTVLGGTNTSYPPNSGYYATLIASEIMT